MTTAGCFPAEIVILSVPVESCRVIEGAAMGDLEPRGDDLGEKEEAEDATSLLAKSCSDIVDKIDQD